ncbi:prepilin-type N-terminal cleavage/methylation domain-containing protein [Enterobacteriaceae bacterium EKM102V]|uniref:prepilin-type N-terminal cleavage/methylation domain-containing protein n=1 Tax=Pantoea TaxID=53335 RepID=UPI00142D945B|nr:MULTISPECIES: prepilin-type N-terminal cleavage/methylation domain-containing protein [Pantoea]KAF6653744.1 prepilin-type N-terminal cleavage/methylation domain-containing protein [Enterobacteriaceae bacterium EKM102V]KAF6664655.1 prepilin-type N-terminal cleavage/methylation domain-containing protein [Pantoea sp. EKM103V]
MKSANVRGFTLPELLLVMVIAGMLSLAALHGWQRWQQRQQLRDSAQQLQGFLLRLRTQANRQNRDLILWSQPGSPWCIGAGRLPAAGCERGKRLHFIAPHAGVTLYGLRGEPGFYGRRNVARAGSIELGNAAGRIWLIISARARIRLCLNDEENCR